jgi:hypothetical protein
MPFRKFIKMVPDYRMPRINSVRDITKLEDGNIVQVA